MFSKRFLSGAALTALTVSMGAGVAHAQSTASQVEEEEVIVVTGTRQSTEGLMAPEQAARARASVTQEYLETQTAGQTVLNSLNLIPGLNFTSTDAYGSSGGAINMRGFDGARISLTVDGIPLNDTGNYAIYSNQQLDPELIQRANVNLGTTDVDSPTASAVGGTVNYITRIPSEDFGVQASYATGSESFGRSFVLVDTGALGPLATRFFGSYSFTEYDQFVGPGALQKEQMNFGFYQPVGEDGDFFRISFHYNENRNNFYYRLNQAQFNAGQAGLSYYDTGCHPGAPTPGAGFSDTQLVAGVSQDGCQGLNFTNYYNHSINPSNTGNIRGQSLFHLGENFTLTVDPSFQYVRANGGGTLGFAETSAQLIGGTPTLGIDLNHDGDFSDTVRLFAPSNTNTYRYGVTSSLIWDITETQRIRFGYTWDWGHHRQTGEFGYLLPNGDPESVFGGEDGFGTPILDARGNVFQKRDRTSIASLEQFSAEYRGDFLNDQFTVILGVRAPEFERELNQHCYAVKGSTSSTQYCTTQTPVVVQPDGFVRFTVGGTQYAPPFQATVSYDEILPNVGLIWRPMERHQVFFSYAEGLSAPRTDDLYSGITVAQLGDVQPETTQAFDLGYRYQGSDLLVSGTVWLSKFQNRIERSADPIDPTLFYSRNVGDVDLWGAELAVAWNVTDDLFLYGSASWTDSELKLTGASVVDTPDWTLSARAEYEFGPLTLGAQANYVGDRYANDANTETAPNYTTVDLDLRYNFGEVMGTHDTYLQLNVINLFDEDYLAQMSSGTATGAALYNLGAPQTIMVQLRTEF